MQESKRVPEQILDILKERGPTLPIQLATRIGISSLFISAYLSELAEEKKIKTSHLRVGGSPLYFLEGQEELLEKFHTFMHPKEIEAFMRIKKYKILRDSEQEPAIRVALRSIKDFAIGFKNNNEIFWRYFSVPEAEINYLLSSEKVEQPKKQEIRKPISVIKPIPKIETLEPKRKIEETNIQEIEEPETLLPKKEIKKKQTAVAFLEEVKSYLNQKNMELVSLESYDKKEVIAKVRYNLAPETTHILFAYNKKKITDKEILKAFKKSLQYKLDYILLFKGELSKKLKDTIEAYKNLLSTERL